MKKPDEAGVRAGMRNVEITNGSSVSEDPRTLLTYREALSAMSDFVWRFAQEAGDDLLTLIGDTGINEAGTPFDPAAWHDWIDNVDCVKAGNRPRSAR